MKNSDILYIIKVYNKLIRTKNWLKKKEDCITFTDKLRWLSIFGCDDLRIRCADKIKAKDYVSEKIDRDICVPTFKIYNNANEINLDELPNQFMIKCNHGCSFNKAIKNKKDINFNVIKQKFNTYLQKDYGTCWEMHYHWIKPLIFTESYLPNNIYNYGFYCFNGKPIFLHITSEGPSGEKYLNTYDINFNPITVLNFRKFKGENKDLKKPKQFSKMLEYAEILSSDFPFVRVDFMYTDNTFYFGELTFTPSACANKYNSEANLMLGSILKI